MKLLAPLLLLLTLEPAFADPPPPSSPFEGLLATARQNSGRQFQDGDRTLAAKAPQIIATLSGHLPEGPAAQAARQKVADLEKAIDDAIGIQQNGFDPSKGKTAPQYTEFVKDVARRLGMDPAACALKYPPTPGGGQNGQGGRGGQQNPVSQPQMSQGSVSHAQKVIGGINGNVFGGDRTAQDLGVGNSVISGGGRGGGQGGGQTLPGNQLPQGFVTHSNAPPDASLGGGKKEENKPGMLDGYKQWWKDTSEEYTKKAAEERKKGADMLAKSMDPNLSWSEKLALKAGAGWSAVKQYGDNLAAGDHETWRNTAIAVGGAAAIVATGGVAGMTVGAAALHIGLAGATGFAIVETGNTLVREPTIKNTAMFALSVAPVGKLEKGSEVLVHALKNSKTAEVIVGYTAKAIPILETAGKGLSEAPIIGKVVEMGGTMVKAIQGSQKAVKVAEYTAEAVGENAGHITHYASERAAHASFSTEVTETHH